MKMCQKKNYVFNQKENLWKIEEKMNLLKKLEMKKKFV